MSMGVRRRMKRYSIIPMTIRKRNKKVAIKHGFEGVREHILPWN
jgi:hypothetical protein